jgi:hypothetical protein
MKADMRSWMLQPTAITPGLSNRTGPRLALAEQFELERACGREGEHMVAGAVEIRELDDRAGAGHRHEGLEGEVALLDAQLPGVGGRRPGRAGERHHRVGDGIALRGAHRHCQVAGFGASAARRMKASRTGRIILDV